LAKASDVAIAVAVLGILGLIIYGGFSLSKWLSNLKLPNLGSLFGFGSGSSGGSGSMVSSDIGAVTGNTPAGAYLTAEQTGYRYFNPLYFEEKPLFDWIYNTFLKPKSYTAPALTQSWQEAYQKVGITNPEQYVQQLQSWVYAEAPSTYQQYQGQYVGYGAE
jgi:hypothetical protein